MNKSLSDQFCPYGLFLVDGSLMLNFVGALIPYVVVILQYSYW
jgi:hypothetical protein